MKGLLLAAALILAGQAAISNFFQRDPYLPSPPPLSIFPASMAEWQVVQESPIDAAVLDMLGPDDTLSREYQDPKTGAHAGVFVAYYKTQLRAKNAHDPKVCLPGSGWNPLANRVEEVRLPEGRKLPVNYYRIARGDASAVVLYWFQTHSGVHTKEQQLRLQRLMDAVKENRTDMALVRIVVPVDAGGVAKADERAYELARQVYPRMLEYFPPTGS
jgi:EpsI family protein